MTFEPLHIVPISRPGQSLSDRAQGTKGTESRQTVKLTSHHRPKPRDAIYERSIHRMNRNRPHISSDTCDVKEHRDKIKPLRQSPARPPACLPNFVVRVVYPRNPTPSSAFFKTPNRSKSRRSTQRRRTYEPRNQLSTTNPVVPVSPQIRPSGVPTKPQPRR